MIKGINKQLIFFKIDGNRYYDSACFVLKNEVLHNSEADRDMLAEANRILEGMQLKPQKRKKRHIFRRLVLTLVLFALGVITGFAWHFFAF